MTDEDLLKIANILWERMKADPSKFKGDPGKDGVDGIPGPKGDKGDSIEGLVVEFQDQNYDVVPSLTQTITPENPVITIPPALINVAAPDDPSKNVTIGGPLGAPIYLHQRGTGSE